MKKSEHAFTGLIDLRPRRPVYCAICGNLIGAWFQYQTSFYPYYHACTERCELLWMFSKQRRYVPAGWKHYPQELRQALLAAAYLEKVLHDECA